MTDVLQEAARVLLARMHNCHHTDMSSRLSCRECVENAQEFADEVAAHVREDIAAEVRAQRDITGFQWLGTLADRIKEQAMQAESRLATLRERVQGLRVDITVRGACTLENLKWNIAIDAVLAILDEPQEPTL